jgi:hypothetical protein
MTPQLNLDIQLFEKKSTILLNNPARQTILLYLDVESLEVLFELEIFIVGFVII